MESWRTIATKSRAYEVGFDYYRGVYNPRRREQGYRQGTYLARRGISCKASTVCGYCAEPYSSKDYPTKVDKSAIRKCAVCKGAHEAWNNRCPARKVELGKVKAVYDARQPYHFVPSTKERPAIARVVFDTTPAEAAAMVNGTQRARPSATTAMPPSLTLTLPLSRKNSRSKFLTKGRALKRVHLGTGLDSTQDKSEDTIMLEDSQRPRRPYVPLRPALELITTNLLLSS
ncbi:hypothetical protein BJ875DRAFT_513796 [Amylocarpus encephaloides]|uniref:Uncharacterized protein n=1 Tax=Amylocarpus encephaloides TaxID=45428 RepID=A0A9P7YG23_9HELO|nr:hypothetical protein BJ875DRAFT_513796 [Amylocarpus encephaloides]